MITRLKYNESLSGEESTHNKKRKTNNIKKMQALAEICRSYPDFKQKITFMDILLKHFGEGGKFHEQRVVHYVNYVILYLLAKIYC